MCYFTSGTTRLPKMTIHRHDYGIAHQVTGKYWLNLNKNDLHWNISDTGWVQRHGAVITVPATVAQPYLFITAMVLVQRTPFQLLKITQLQQCVVHQPSTKEVLLRNYQSMTFQACDTVLVLESLQLQIIETWKSATD